MGVFGMVVICWCVGFVLVGCFVLGSSLGIVFVG